MPEVKTYLSEKSFCIDADSILGSLAFPIIVVSCKNEILYVNGAAEQFVERASRRLLGSLLTHIFPDHSPIIDFVRKVRQSETSILEYGVHLEMPSNGSGVFTLSGAPVIQEEGVVVLSIHQQLTVRHLERQQETRQAARSATAMASMLAHEVKNPLSGIRGAAQLLERSVSGADKSLALLIQDETDRVCDLVDRVDLFAETDFLIRQPINIHEILELVVKTASVGFANDINFVKNFDPSLPLVLGNRDLLVQIFFNLVKNASEATSSPLGQVVVKTEFRSGVSLKLSGGKEKVHLPLCVSIADNGVGIDESIIHSFFDPFITTKVNGTGLGLAFVAKAVDHHGGLIEFDTSTNGTEFRVFLPIEQLNGEKS